MFTPVPVSAVILCHNEAVNLPRCTEAARACAETIVVDDGSTDESPRIAAAAGARVVTHPFVSFADQRNWALDAAGLSCDWTLHLDADEIVTPESLAEIRGILPTLDRGQVGFLARKVILDGRWLRFSADYPVYVPRLVHRRGPRFAMRGHGEIIDAPPDTAVFLREPMLHHAFSKGWAEWRERHERYAAAEAARIAEHGASFAWREIFSTDRSRRRRARRALSFRLPGRPVLRFLYAYVARGGFLDGAPGFRFCRAMAGYEAMINRALKHRHLNNPRGRACASH